MGAAWSVGVKRRKRKKRKKRRERRKRRKREDYLTKRVSAPSSLNYEMYMRTDVNQKLIGSGSQKLVIFISLINLQNIIRFWELQGFTFFNFWFPKPYNV